MMRRLAAAVIIAAAAVSAIGLSDAAIAKSRVMGTIQDRPIDSGKIIEWRTGSDTAPRSWVVWIHGGSWAFGSADAAGSQQYCQTVLALGADCFSIEYTLLPDAVWPDQYHEIADDVAWLRQNAAALNIDPALGVLTGHSAGGQLATVTALHDRQILSFADFSGAVDPVAVIASGNSVAPYAQQLMQNSDTSAAYAQSTRAVTNFSICPRRPAYVEHATGDQTIAFSESQQFVASLQANGCTVTFNAVKSAAHTTNFYDGSDAPFASWLRRTLGLS